jgi:hypothetical protein
MKKKKKTLGKYFEKRPQRNAFTSERVESIPLSAHV